MKTNSLQAGIAAFFLSATANSAHAQYTTYYPNDTTINFNASTNAVIGYANYNDNINRTNGTSPTVNFVTGGSAGYLLTYNGSVLNMTGGNVGRTVQAQDNSTVNISGGTVSSLTFASNNSRLNVSGGILGDSLNAYNNSVVNVNGELLAIA